MKNYLKKIKKEKGAVSLLVIVTVLTFVLILLGAYMLITSLRKSQVQSDIRIQEVYGEDVKNVNKIYEEKMIQINAMYIEEVIETNSIVVNEV